MGENCIYKNKRIVIWVGLFLCLLFGAFISTGKPSKALDLNYEDFALLKIDGSKTVLEVENSKNFDSNTAPSYAVNNFKYIEDNKLIFVMKFNFSCQGVAKDLSDNTLINLFGQNWQAAIFDTLVNEYNLRVDYADGGYKASQETFGIVNGYTESDWIAIIAKSFPKKADSIDKRVRDIVMANMKATFHLMVEQNKYIKLTDLPSSEERLIYYCASSADNKTITSENGAYTFTDYDQLSTSMNDSTGYIASYLHLFSSYTLTIKAAHNGSHVLDLNNDGDTSDIRTGDAYFTSFIFPAYYDLAAMNADGASFTSPDPKYLVDAGDRTKALFCNNWMEGQLRLEQGDQKYYGYCDGGYTFIKNQGETTWEIRREIDLSSFINGHDLIWNESKQDYDLHSYTYKFPDGPHELSLNFAMEQEIVNFGFTFAEGDPLGDPVELSELETILQTFKADRNANFENFSTVVTSYFLDTLISKLNYISIQGGTEENYLDYLNQVHNLLMTANNASMSAVNWLGHIAGEVLDAVVEAGKAVVGFIGDQINTLLGKETEPEEVDPVQEKLKEVNYLLGIKNDWEPDLSATFSNAPQRINAVFTVIYEYFFAAVEDQCINEGSVEGCLMTYDEFKTFTRGAALDFISVWNNSELLKNYPNNPKFNAFCKMLFMVGVAGQAIGVVGTTASALGGALSPNLMIGSGLFSTVFPTVGFLSLRLAGILKATEVVGYTLKMILDEIFGEWTDIFEAAIEVFNLAINDPSALDMLAGPVYQVYVETMLFGYDTEEYHNKEFADLGGSTLLAGAGGKTSGFFAKVGANFGILFDFIIEAKKEYLRIDIASMAALFETHANYKQCMIDNGYFDAGKIAGWTVAAIITDVVMAGGTAVMPLLVAGVTVAAYKLLFNECTGHLFSKMLEIGALNITSKFQAIKKSWEQKKNNSDAPDSYDYLMSAYQTASIYSYFYDWVVEPYGQYYNADTGKMAQRRHVDLYNYFIMALKSKFVNATYTTTSKNINIIIDRTSPDQVVIDDEISSSVKQESLGVMQKDTQNYQIVYRKVSVIPGETDVSNLYVFKGGVYVPTVGKAVKNVDYYECIRKTNNQTAQLVHVAVGSSVQGYYVFNKSLNMFVPAVGTAEKGQTYYTYIEEPLGNVDKIAEAYQQDKLISNKDYTFGAYSSHYGDANIKFNKGATDRWIVGSGIDHFDYVIFRNIGKLGQLNDLELYGNVKYEKVAVTPNVTNLDLEELYTLKDGVYTLATGIAAEGQTYYKKVDLEKLWKSFSGFSTDIRTIIGSLTSVENNLIYDQLWSPLSAGDTFTIEEDGHYIILVRAVDFVGNRGAVTVKQVLIDTVAPEILLDFSNGDAPIVATNEQYQDIANAIKNGEKANYEFIISDESISKMNISLVEETNESSFASGLLVNENKLTSFKMCIADILNGGDENCLKLNKQFYGYGDNQKGYISASALDNKAILEAEWESGIHSSNSVKGVYKPSLGQYVMSVDFGENIATIYRVAFQITDVAGNETLVKILVVSNISNIEIESDISTKAEYDLTNPDNKIKDFDVTLLYNRFVIGDLTYKGEASKNEVPGNYLDLNDEDIMTYRYFVIGKSDRDKFYKLRDSAACDLDNNPNNPACGRDNNELSDRFLQVEPSNKLENLITSLTNLNEDHFIFQQFELKLGGSKKEYTYVIMQEFEYSLEDLMKQLSFTVNEYGHEVGSIVTDPTFELLSSEKFEFRLKFIDYSKYDKTGKADYGCIDEEKNVCYNLINKIHYSFNLYRLGISNPESSEHYVGRELNTYTDFVDIDEQSFDQTTFITNTKHIVYKPNTSDQEVDYIEYYIYINLLDYAEELKYTPTFSINDFMLVSTKNMKREHYDSNGELIENLTSTYLLLDEDETGFTIYTNYLEDNDDGNSKIDQVPNLGSFEFDPTMDVKEYDDNGKATRWTNQSTLIFSLTDGSASFDYIFDPTLIYQYTVFPNNIREDYATALIADYYNIDLLNVLLVCQKPGDTLCASAVTNQRLALINKYLETISRPDFNKLNRHLNNNNLSLVNVDMKILKELDIYTIEYQKIVAEYMYNLNDTVGIYNYLVNSSIEETPLDRLKSAISSAVTTVEFWPTTYRIYSNMLGWNTVPFDTDNKTTGVINASRFITDTNNKSYIILYRVIDVLGRSSMDFKEITYFQTVPTVTVTGEQIMDLADPIFSSSLSKNSLDQYLLDNRLVEYFDGNEEYFKLVNKNTIKYCIMINGECVEPNNDVIKENIFVGNTYQVVFSMDDYAGNTLSIPVSYKVIYSRKPSVNISTIDGYAKEKTLDVNVIYTSIGGVDVKTIEMSYCSDACQLSNGDVDLVNNTYKGKELKDLTQEELNTLYELMMSVSGKLELTLSNDSRNASTSSPVKLNGWYLARVITTNAPKNSVPPYAELTETIYSPVFVLDKTDNKAPVVLLGDENRVNDNSYSTLLPNGVDGTTENYYFNTPNVFLFVKDNEVGISGATVKLVKKVAKDCAFVPAEEEDFHCFNTEIEAGLAIESTLLDGNVWKFDLSPNRNRVGKSTYYLRASDDLGNIVYRRIDVQVDTQAPEIDAVRTKVNSDSISNNLYVESPEIVIDFAANANLSSGFEVASPLHRVVIYEPNHNEDNPTVRLCSEYNNCNGVSKLKYNLAMEIDVPSGNRFYKNGMKEIIIELYDAAGNVSASHKFNVLLDTDAPKISVELSSDSVINNVGQIVKINAVDSTSTIFNGEFSEDGVTHYGLAYRKDGSNIWVKIDDMSVLLTENGKYIFRAYDFALNYSEAIVEINNIDKEAPAVKFSVDGNSNALPTHNVAIQIEDKLSNIKVIKYCWIKYGEIDCVEYEYTNNLITNNTKVFEVTANKSVSKVIENGEYLLSVYVEDIWGNSSVYQTKTFSFDCKKPNIIPNITLDYKKCAFESSLDCFNPETEMYEFLIELTNSKNILDLQLSETAKVYISGFTTTEISGVYVNLVGNEFTTLNANKINYYDAVAGTYYLRYSVEYKDVNDNNQVESAIVKIVIKDAQAPIITIRGESNITYTVGTLSSYEDEGVGIVDVHDGNIVFKETWRKYYFSEANNPFSEAMQEVPQINPNIVGTYYVLYEAYDLTGNRQTAVRTVKFVDDVAPVISFDSGDDIDNYLVGNDFDYLKGITIKDNYDGVIVEDYVNESSEASKDFSKLIISYYIYSEDAKAFVPQNTLQFTKIVGIHKYTYRFKDRHEQEATLDRYIKVKDVVATMVVEGDVTTFDLSDNKEGIVDGAISINPNGLNLKINGVAYTETTILNQVGKHSIMISDNYNNSVEYSIYMDTSTPGDTKTVLVDKTKVTVEQTIIKTIDANTTALDLTADLAEGGSLSRFVDNPNYVIVIAIFCDDLNNTNGVACSDNYLELSVLENITAANSVVSMSNVRDKITFDDDEIKNILEQTNGGKVALLVMSAEESATIAQAFVPEEKNTSSKISLVLIIGIPSLLGLYVLIRIFKFKKSIKTM